MSKKAFTIGLHEVQFGKASPVGFMPEATSKLGKVYQDTCKVTQDAPETTEHFEEGNPLPFFRSVTKKPAKLSFSIVVEDLETLERLIGGRTAGNEWVDGGNFAANLALRAVSKQGLVIEIPNASISGSFDWDMSDKGVCKIAVEAVPQSVSTGRAFAAVFQDEPLKLDKSILEFGKAADTTGIAVNAGAAVTAAVVLDNASWITTTQSGTNVTIKVQANSGAERSGQVYIVAGKRSAIVTVAQRGV